MTVHAEGADFSELYRMHKQLPVGLNCDTYGGLVKKKYQNLGLCIDLSSFKKKKNLLL